MNINIMEIFPSIQGEGYRAGQPAIFVRTQGCHVGCKFCDTRSSWQTRVGDLTQSNTANVTDVLQHWKKRYPNVNLIVITGGEPLEQLQSIYDLILKIRNDELLKNMVISIETSGSSNDPFTGDELTMLSAIAISCEITLSPKPARPPFSWFYTWCHSLKLLVGKDGYIGPYELDEVLGRMPHGIIKDGRVYLQPLDWGSAEDIAKTNLVCLDMAINYGFPISVQAHKFLNYK